MLIFKEIEILGLFGEVNVKLPIRDNRLILVGYNGIGKSTILNIFYYVISQQWNKLREMDFTSVTIKLKNNNRKLSVKKEEILEHLHFRGRYKRRPTSVHRNYPESLYRRAYEILERWSLRSGHSRIKPTSEAIEVLRAELGMSISMAREVAEEIVFRGQEEFEFADLPAKNIVEVDRYLNENMNGRILYLPTYRRIEKDIKIVFPEIEDELRRALTRRVRDTSRSENYIELVQFGMEDVQTKISTSLEKVRAYALSQINSLTTKYLRDVIRNEANKFENFEEHEFSEASLNTVFAKVDSAILSDDDKKNIAKVVEKIRENKSLFENEKYVAHYVLYLVEVGKNISKLERPIEDFISICNSYLYGKAFSFDNIAYRVVIQHASGRPVQMEDLSSGEKQIVSLFSHLILDSDISNYIVIDEPELSLSVDWQQRFLEDISKLDTCSFICAVTHSPFIFENSLDQNTVDLLEYTTVSG